MKCYPFDMPQVLHAAIHSSCGYLHKIKPGKIPLWMKEGPHDPFWRLMDVEAESLFFGNVATGRLIIPQGRVKQNVHIGNTN